MSLNDQFEYGRIPLKPLPYSNKELASCNEFIIDYGENGSYHMFISDSNDPTILIDLTSKIIKEILPNAKINANQFQIVIEGIDDPTSLQDIINFIYKRFAYPDDPNGFDYTRDIDKVLDPNAKSILLRNTDGTILLPITLASNVYDESGKTIQDRLSNITRVAVKHSYIFAEEDGQTQFTFPYPFENYDGNVEVFIGTTYVAQDRYTITPDADVDGYYENGILNFTDIRVEKGRRIDFQFIYNYKAPDGGPYNKMDGSAIIDGTIPIIKLQKYSDSCNLNDSTSVATSAALAKMYEQLMHNLQDNSIGYSAANLQAISDNQTEFIFEYPYKNYFDHTEIRIGAVYIDESRYTIEPILDDDGFYAKAKLTLNEGLENGRRIDIIFIYNKGTGKVIWTVDSDPSSDTIVIDIDKHYPNLLDPEISENFFVNILLKNSKTPDKIYIKYANSTKEYMIKTIDRDDVVRPLPAGRIVRFLVDNVDKTNDNKNIAYLISAGNNISTSRHIHTCIDQETIIPYSALQYNEGDIINVYRNGVRLFEDLDYSIDTSEEKITLFVRTEEGERIIFEALSYQ